MQRHRRPSRNTAVARVLSAFVLTLQLQSRLASRLKTLRGPHVARGPRVPHPCCTGSQKLNTTYYDVNDSAEPTNNFSNKHKGHAIKFYLIIIDNISWRFNNSSNRRRFLIETNQSGQSSAGNEVDRGRLTSEPPRSINGTMTAIRLVL